MDPFVGEIRLVAFNYAPSANWMVCDGTLLQIRQHTALFSLIGTTYGGDGQTTFGLPNLTKSGPFAPGQGQGAYYIAINGIYPTRP